MMSGLWYKCVAGAGPVKHLCCCQWSFSFTVIITGKQMHPVGIETSFSNTDRQMATLWRLYSDRLHRWRCLCLANGNRWLECSDIFSWTFHLLDWMSTRFTHSCTYITLVMRRQTYATTQVCLICMLSWFYWICMHFSPTKVGRPS